MKAIVITKLGGAEALDVCDVETPEPCGDQVRIRVRAAALNRADLMQARGSYPAPPGVPADIPGLEYAGEVDKLGPNVIGPLKIGDRVFGIVGGGGQAEYVLSPERMVVPIPANLDFEQAAAVPEVFMTAHDALETQGGAKPGERVLIHAVGSGVGSAAVQIAHTMGCVVLGTSRTADKLEQAKKLGLDVGIHANAEELADAVRPHTNGQGVNLIIDLLGAVALAGNVAALATCGRLVLVGLLGGGSASIDLTTLLRKRIRVVGTTLRARPLEEKILVTQAFADRVVPWLERGLVRPIVDRVFALDDVRAAQTRLESNHGFGKVILRL
ncbi:NAD(P)H-quinone oxidoreductase [Singulisphaera acidiphila]|uniref:Putative NAD(P)H quinone oxidoreductase, PIG3 family n=1 Tax=Singulisphaera acidiphila (strain ATCC BAA-1392 / DSM 18658 / VKM B-2454 / MOB10) TaxID=886293 RepID=L0D777_SINAD|nr:NAD(P)H-quinone oxidoreductase [Singulisphaera acidiphila]AGA25097.1 putative NAD(P)H quinone oxidoreductase, PIG3 family [Singulisphaera acidiphila DSM 18658]